VIGGPVSPLIWGFSAAAAVSAFLCIRGKYEGSQLLVFVFKPLTTILLLIMALATGATQSSYGSLVVVAILFSLLGDILLMLPRDRFLQGLLSFLVAHVVLILAFTLEWSGVTWGLVPVVAVAALGMFTALAPHLGRMKIPVTVYIAVIGTMVWVGCERLLGTGSFSGILAGVGAILFMFSDSVLGLNRFRASFRSADLIVLSSYWMSLWLIALSVRPDWM
jgi:uncharacterized membrane protein YhhN